MAKSATMFQSKVQHCKRQTLGAHSVALYCWLAGEMALYFSLPASVKFLRPLITFANNLDSDEAPQNVGPHLKS